MALPFHVILHSSFWTLVRSILGSRQILSRFLLPFHLKSFDLSAPRGLLSFVKNVFLSFNIVFLLFSIRVEFLFDSRTRTHTQNTGMLGFFLNLVTPYFKLSPITPARQTRAFLISQSKFLTGTYIFCTQ